MSQILVTGEAKIRDIQGPVVSNSGVITALDGDASQYVRGDGTLADFPTSTGGGSSVSYYLNSSVSQGTIGGVAYRQLGKTPISGAGTDIAISSNGYVASYITDANDPALLEVPAGNFNCEFYFSVNNNTGDPFVYAEVYKYDGTTFTLLGTSVGVPEYITEGTVINPYYFAVPVAVAALTITDRLAIRIYVNVDGRVVTLHTENNHLCQVVTTFSKGLISLNNLTRQNQFFATGTSGTDFNISSATATHTFNIPVASAANTGKLSSTDWSTFNGKVPYTGATANVDLGDNDLIAQGVSGIVLEARVSGLSSSPLVLRTGTTGIAYGTNAISLISSSTTANTLIITSDIASVTKTAQIGLGSLTASRTFTLPDITGTLALLEADNIFTGINSFDIGINYKTNAVQGLVSGYISQAYAKSGSGAGSILSMKISDGNSVKNIILDFVGTPATYTYTFPASSGTIALTSNIPSITGLIPYTGATSTVNLGTNVIYSASAFIEGTGAFNGSLNIKQYVTPLTTGAGYTCLFAGTSSLGMTFGTSNAAFFDGSTISANRTYTLPNASGTLALTSDLSAYLPLAGGTLTGALSGTSATFSGAVNSDGRFGATTNQTSPSDGSAYFYKSSAGAVVSGFQFIAETGGAGSRGTRLTIDNTGAATFSSSVTANSSGSLFNANTGGLSANILTIKGGGGSGAFGFRVEANNGDAIFRTNNFSYNVLMCENGGNVGIGTSSPSYQLQLSTDSAAKPTSALWTIASDERIKENINTYKKGLQELLNINPVTYDYNGLGGFVKGKGGVGIIAQEIIDILPDSVSSIKAKLNETDEEETDILNFNGHELIYVLINSIKEQQAQIEELKALIAAK